MKWPGGSRNKGNQVRTKKTRLLIHVHNYRVHVIQTVKSVILSWLQNDGTWGFSVDQLKGNHFCPPELFWGNLFPLSCMVYREPPSSINSDTVQDDRERSCEEERRRLSPWTTDDYTLNL